MPLFSPEDLSAWTGGRWAGTPLAQASGFSIDSRRLSAGQIFVALKTDRRDGHAFVGAAEREGAAAAIVARPVRGAAIPQLVVDDPLAAFQAIAKSHRRRFKGPVVGVTGSAGKTSTKEILAALLGGEEGGVLATEGNLNNHIGVALTLTRLEPGRHAVAVVEVGISAPGEMRTLAWMVEPDLALVTLVGPAHLEELGGLEGVAREKAALAGALRRGGLCLFPSDCGAFEAFRAIGAERGLVVERGSRKPARGPWPRACYSVVHTQARTTVSVSYGPAPAARASIRRVTDGMARNLALAICAAVKLGVPKKALARRIRSWRPSPLRGEWRHLKGRNVYLDCYNANPASMLDALAIFAAVTPPRRPRLFIIGCMEELGAEASRYHRDLGKTFTLREGDRLVVIGGEAESVRRGALESGNDASCVEVVETLEAVAAEISGFHGSVFVKGSRRHQLEQALAGLGNTEAVHA